MCVTKFINFVLTFAWFISKFIAVLLRLFRHEAACSGKEQARWEAAQCHATSCARTPATSATQISWMMVCFIANRKRWTGDSNQKCDGFECADARGPRWLPYMRVQFWDVLANQEPISSFWAGPTAAELCTLAACTPIVLRQQRENIKFCEKQEQMAKRENIGVAEATLRHAGVWELNINPSTKTRKLERTQNLAGLELGKGPCGCT